MRNFPKQRVSYTAKITNNYQWCRDTMDNLLLNYATDQGVVNAYQSDYDRMLSNYQLYNNQINQADFERECNPLGLNVGQFENEIQPYNKTYNKIQVLLGEELRRPFNFRVVLTNPDGIKTKMAHKDAMFRNYVNSKIQEVLTSMQVELGEDMFDPNTLVDPRELDTYMSTTYLDAREILGSKLLEYLVKALDIKDLKNDAFKHGLISGLESAHIDVINGEPVISPLNSLGLFYHKSPEVKYIQDSLYAGYRTYMTSGDILDTFGNDLDEDALKKIDRSREGRSGSFSSHLNPDMIYHHNDYYLNNQLHDISHEGSYGDSITTVSDWLVQHVEWRSQKKVGFLNFSNEYGDKEMDMVSEEFEVPKYATRATIEEALGRKTTYYTWTDAAGTMFSLNWG